MPNIGNKTVLYVFTVIFYCDVALVSDYIVYSSKTFQPVENIATSRWAVNEKSCGNTDTLNITSIIDSFISAVNVLEFRNNYEMNFFERYWRLFDSVRTCNLATGTCVW